MIQLTNYSSRKILAEQEPPKARIDFRREALLHPVKPDWDWQFKAGPGNLMNLVIMRARMEGFIVIDYMDRAGIAVEELLGWVGSGELKFQVDLQEGFENIPATLNRLFTGKNLGKQLLKIADPS